MLFIIPVRNQAQQVEAIFLKFLHFIRLLQGAQPQWARQLTIRNLLWIDDGSQDETVEVLEVLRKEHRFSLLTHERPMGYGQILYEGIKFGRDNFAIYAVFLDSIMLMEEGMLGKTLELINQLHTFQIVFGDFRRGEMGITAPVYDANAATGVLLWQRPEIKAIRATFIERIGEDMPDIFCGFQALQLAQVGEDDLDEDGYFSLLQLFLQQKARGSKIVSHFLPGESIQPERFDRKMLRLEKWIEELDHSMQREFIFFDANVYEKNV